MTVKPSNSSGPPFPKPKFSGNRFQNLNQSRNQNKDEHRINEQIRVPQVRLIDEKGGQVGVVSTYEALRLAREKGLDLMEVSATSTPPVCKICDYGKFKYEKKKKEQQAKKKQTVIKVKEVQFRPSTEAHDRQYKFRNIRTFLENGDKAKVSVMFRGREIAHTAPGYEIMQELIEQIKDVGIIESPPKMDGKKLVMVIAPVAKKAAAGQKPSSKVESALSDKASSS